MLAGFYTNIGMGCQNLVHLSPPLIGSDDIGAYLWFDRIHVDGEIFDWIGSQDGGSNARLFGALADHGLLEPRRDYYDQGDVCEGQKLFIDIYRKLGPGQGEFPEPGASFERALSRARTPAGCQMGAAYYMFMKNYLGLLAAKRMGCALIDGRGGHRVPV